MYKLSTSFSISLPTCIIVSFLKNVSIFSCAYLSSTISALVKQIKSLAHFKNNDLFPYCYVWDFFMYSDQKFFVIVSLANIFSKSVASFILLTGCF